MPMRRSLLQALGATMVFAALAALDVVFAATPPGPAPNLAATPADAEALAERMLGTLGGRAAWARTRNTVNASIQSRLTEPYTVRAVITLEFDRPRFRIESTAPGLNLVRVVDGERHWRRTREGRIEDLAPELLAEDRRWYAAHVYRTLHRIAARDPALALSIGDDGRLVVSEGGARLAWFRLDGRGEPYHFGALDDEVGTLSGPWTFERDGLRHPVWVSRPDGSWRARIEALEVDVAIDDAIYRRPGP